MAQAGIHGLVAMAVRKWTPERTWLVLGVVLGSILPDADNLAVAVATLTKKSTEGLHRTFTHSLFTILVVVLVFYLVSLLTRQKRWNNLGIGLGVAILWPIPSWVDLWSGVTPPDWWTRLMQPLELLFFALFFLSLGLMARKQKTDLSFLGKLRLWTWLQIGLFVVFLVLVYTMSKGFLTIFGAVYLLSLGLAVGVTLRMRKTIEPGAASA